MEMFMRDTVLSGVDLIYLGSDCFNTEYLTVSLISPLSKKTAPYNAVLPSVLARGTATYPDEEEVEKKLSGLHAEITPFVRKRGEAQVFGFASRFCGENFSGVVGLLSEMLAYPKTKNGRLLEEFILSEKEKLLASIRAAVGDMRSFAKGKLFSAMFPKESFAVPALGTETEANRISVMTLTRHYHTVLRDAKIEIFYAGGLDFDTVKNTLVSAFSCLPRLPQYASEHTVPYDTERDGVKTLVTVQEETEESIAVLGVCLGKNYHRTSLASLWVFEKLYADSLPSAVTEADYFKGILTVTAKADDRTEDAVLGRLADICAGRFTDDELNDAKRAVISSLHALQSDAEAAGEYYADTFAAGNFFTPAETAELTENVTREDILFIAETVRPDTILYLRKKER